MNKLQTYIDRLLIDEYASKNFRDGHYSLDIDDIPQHDLDNFLDVLMAEDTTLRDLVRFQMQRLINARLDVLQLRSSAA